MLFQEQQDVDFGTSTFVHVKLLNSNSAQQQGEQKTEIMLEQISDQTIISSYSQSNHTVKVSGA